MRILYLSLSYLPSRRASSIQVMKMCQSLARLGHQVTLISKHCPSRQEKNVVDDYQFYGVASNFTIEKLPRPAWWGGGSVYAFCMWRFLRQRRTHIDLAYSRDLLGATIAFWLGIPVLFEAHGLPEGWVSRLLHKRLFQSPALRRLVVISQALRDDFERLRLLPEEKNVVVAHDGADACKLDETEHDAEISCSLFVRNDKRHIGYVGNLYPGKGMEVIVELAKRLSDCDVHVVGGSAKDLQSWAQRGTPQNLIFHGFVPPKELYHYYKQFEVLLLPPQQYVRGASGATDISRWMSPLKMFEYMATGKPIVSSNLPVLGEVLAHGKNALVVPPADINAWEVATKQLLADPSLRRKLGEAARQDFLKSYTWDARARRVTDGL